MIVQNAVFSHGVFYLPFEKLYGIIINKDIPAEIAGDQAKKNAHDMCVK